MTPDDQIDAAELALGLLEGEERIAALERLLADPAFAREVAWWRERFAPLFEHYSEAEAPDAAHIDVASDPAPGSEHAPRGHWQWLLGGAAGGALAASFAAMVLSPVATVVEQPPAIASGSWPGPLVSVLTFDGKDAGSPIAAVVDRRGRSVRFTGKVVVPEGRVAELWRIGADKVPHPLGLLKRDFRTSKLRDSATLPGENEVLAISIEPDGGSPTGQPTGPVIASGSLLTV